LSDAGAETVIRRYPQCIIVGAPPTAIQAIPVPGGYRVTGRVPFISTCQNATWYTANARIGEGEQLPQGTAPPALVRVFLPMEACEIIDTWHVLGMRGTGSHDVAVTDVFVPGLKPTSLSPGAK
jgi:alkylation response protein AidB-like acyl-CoA dehydrogenase